MRDSALSSAKGSSRPAIAHDDGRGTPAGTATATWQASAAWDEAPCDAGQRAVRRLDRGERFRGHRLRLIFGLFVGHPHPRHHPGRAPGVGQPVSAPGHAFSITFSTVANAYGRSSRDRSSALRCQPRHLDRTGWTAVFTPISETLVAATPLILAGIGVALGFPPECSISVARGS